MEKIRTSKTKKSEKYVQNARKNKENEKFFDPTNLNKALSKSGMSVKEIATRIHKTERAVYYYLRGERIIPEDVLNDLSALLNASPEFLLGKSNHPEGGISAMLKDWDDKTRSIYGSTFRLLNDMGVSWSIEGDKLFIDTDSHTHIYIDYSMFWFILRNIRNYAKNLFDEYCTSGVYLNGAKGLLDIDETALTEWETESDS